MWYEEPKPARPRHRLFEVPRGPRWTSRCDQCWYPVPSTGWCAECGYHTTLEWAKPVAGQARDVRDVAACLRLASIGAALLALAGSVGMVVAVMFPGITVTLLNLLVLAIGLTLSELSLARARKAIARTEAAAGLDEERRPHWPGRILAFLAMVALIGSGAISVVAQPVRFSPNLLQVAWWALGFGWILWQAVGLRSITMRIGNLMSRRRADRLVGFVAQGLWAAPIGWMLTIVSGCGLGLLIPFWWVAACLWLTLSLAAHGRAWRAVSLDNQHTPAPQAG